MAAIYDYETGSELTAGLSGCNTCDCAVQVAERLADQRGDDVELWDDDGRWLVHPIGDSADREAADYLGECEGEA